MSVGANAADSHYEPLAGRSSRVERGSFVLIDIWGKLKDDPAAVWYDITWTGVVDRDATELEGKVNLFFHDGGVLADKMNIRQVLKGGLAYVEITADRARLIQAEHVGPSFPSFLPVTVLAAIK